MRNGTGTRDAPDAAPETVAPDGSWAARSARVALRVLGTFEATVRRAAGVARRAPGSGPCWPGCWWPTAARCRPSRSSTTSGAGSGRRLDPLVGARVRLPAAPRAGRRGHLSPRRRVRAGPAAWSPWTRTAFVADVARGRGLLARGDDEDAARILAAALDRWVGPRVFGDLANMPFLEITCRAAGGAAGERGRDAGRRARPARPGRPATWPCSRSWRRSTRCASRWRCAWSPPCTRPAGRPTRWPRSNAAGARWPTSWASTRPRRCAGCTPPCWPRRRRRPRPRWAAARR